MNAKALHTKTVVLAAALILGTFAASGCLSTSPARLAASHGLPVALADAREWSPDSALVGVAGVEARNPDRFLATSHEAEWIKTLVRTSDSEFDGQSEAWLYLFISETRGTWLAVVIGADGETRAVFETVPEDETRSEWEEPSVLTIIKGAAAIHAWTIDSSNAVVAAQGSPGWEGSARTAVAMIHTLRVDETNRMVWQILAVGRGGTEGFRVDARTGTHVTSGVERAVEPEDGNLAGKLSPARPEDGHILRLERQGHGALAFTPTFNLSPPGTILNITVQSPAGTSTAWDVAYDPARAPWTNHVYHPVPGDWWVTVKLQGSVLADYSIHWTTQDVETDHPA